jgi:hypothetical protein
MEGFVPPSVLSWKDKNDNCLLSDRLGQVDGFPKELTAPLMSGMGHSTKSLRDSRVRRVPIGVRDERDRDRR